MEIKAYIESGILELYVLGQLSLEERQDVERMAAEHEAIRTELSEIENSMQLYAQEQAIEPAEEVRHRVLNSLITNLGDDRNFTPAHANASAEAKVTALRASKTTVFYKYAFAASLLLLCLSIAALATVYHSLQVANGQLVALQTQNQHYSSTVHLMDSELAVYRDPSYKLITLQGTPQSPSSALRVAWSAAKRKVLLDEKYIHLPANDAQHQYQLWALVNGKPVNLGVFDARNDSAGQLMLPMKPIDAADAFAVTLEPRGGSASPTMSAMVVIAKI